MVEDVPGTGVVTELEVNGGTVSEVDSVDS